MSESSVHIAGTHVVHSLAGDKLLHQLNALAAALPNLKSGHRPVLQHLRSTQDPHSEACTTGRWGGVAGARHSEARGTWAEDRKSSSHPRRKAVTAPRCHASPSCPLLSATASSVIRCPARKAPMFH